MFNEVLKIVPKIDDADLRKMENALQSRFTKISKGFGKGLMTVLKGAGIAGLALGLIDKLLNPLQAVQEAIERSLNASDDIATQANQFNTTSGKLFKLVQVAKSTGLDEGGLFTLITKFQSAVAQAKANPQDQSVSSVRNFTGQKDTAESFFNFIQALQKMDDTQRILVQNQVFGERQIGKMSEFLNSDFKKQFEATGLDKADTTKLTQANDKLAGLGDLADQLKVKNATNDLFAKAGIINESMIRQRAKSEALAMQKENMQIKSYNDLAAISDTVSKIMIMVEQGVAMVGKLISWLMPAVNKLVDAAEKFLKSPMVRGIKGFFGGGKDE